MNILILNWRDIKNPTSGGAEILTHELSKGWCKKGHTVTVLSSNFSGARKTEIIDNVKFKRAGKWWSVHLLAFFYYLKNKDNFDIIIDEVHWFPFFTAIYARKKTIALTCERATNLFPKIFPPLISHFFQFIEKIYFALYKNIPTMVISESTKKDLIQAGINKGKITIIPMGITLPKNLKKYPKEKNPTFIYLGRLNKQKGIVDAIEAFKKINKQKTILNPKSYVLSPKSNILNPVLWILGSGEQNFVASVKDLVKKYNLSKSVKFFGRVSEERKFELLTRSHILLVPSLHEGWGLTVPEASYVGTPSIVYNVAGLSDIVDQKRTGIIVRKNNPDELRKEALKLINNKSLYKRLQVAGREHARSMTWQKTVEKSLEVLKKYEQ